jgi:N-acetylated-alpha-linked acidic dipeptidase
MRFQGPYGVYHSVYDTHDWVSRFADPGFFRHAELTRIWTSLATRLANADLLPLDQVRYARRIGDFLAEVEERWGARLGDASNALARFDAAALRHSEAASLALEEDNQAALDVINRALMGVEPSFIDQAGLDGRPWYRHLLYAPAFGYEPEVLPGLSEAVGSRNRTRVAEEERRLAAALDRAARALAFPTTVEGAP